MLLNCDNTLLPVNKVIEVIVIIILVLDQNFYWYAMSKLNGCPYNILFLIPILFFTKI